MQQSELFASPGKAVAGIPRRKNWADQVDAITRARGAQFEPPPHSFEAEPVSLGPLPSWLRDALNADWARARPATGTPSQLTK